MNNLKDEKVRLIIMAGQSNMVGQGDLSEIKQISLPQKYSYLNFGFNSNMKLSTETFSPELGLVSELKRFKAGNRVIILKYAAGASSMLDWSPNYSFEKAKITGHSEFGNLYCKLLDRVDSLMVNEKAIPVAMLWMQGERDAKIPIAGFEYEINLEEFIRNIRDHTKHKDLPFILGRINPPHEGYTARNVVRKAQERIVTNMYNVSMVNTDDLAKRDDSLHYSTKGQIELGHRYGKQFMKAINDTL